MQVVNAACAAQAKKRVWTHSQEEQDQEDAKAHTGYSCAKHVSTMPMLQLHAVCMAPCPIW